MFYAVTYMYFNMKSPQYMAMSMGAIPKNIESYLIAFAGKDSVVYNKDIVLCWSNGL